MASYRATVVLALLLLTVTLGPPFGRAEAAAVEAGPPFVVQVTVDVSGDPEAVLMRPISAGGELDRVAMVLREDGSWGGVLRLTERENIRVAFEALQRDGSSEISEPSTLTQLGVDPAVFALATTTTAAVPGSSLPVGAGWLTVAIVAVVGSIGAIGVWAMTGRRSGEAGDGDAGDLTVDSSVGEDVLSGNLEHSGEPDHDLPHDRSP